MPPTAEYATAICRLFQPREGPLRGGVDGYRCLKIGTGRFPVRMRVVQVATQPGQEPEEKPRLVDIRQHGFEGKAELQGTTSSRGDYETVRLGEYGLFDHVAFVSIKLDGTREARVPIPLVADRVETIPVSDAGQDNEMFRFHRDGWMRKVADSYLVQTMVFQEIKELASKPAQRGQALTRARGRPDPLPR